MQVNNRILGNDHFHVSRRWLRFVTDIPGEPEPVKIRHFGGGYKDFRMRQHVRTVHVALYVEEVQAFLSVFGNLGMPRNLRPHHNIAPTTFIVAVTTRVRNHAVVGREMVPRWWKKYRKDVPAAFNAWAETVPSGSRQ